MHLNHQNIGSLKNNAPELINFNTNGFYSGNKKYQSDALDVFSLGCFLFELVMKCQPFKSSDIKD